MYIYNLVFTFLTNKCFLKEEPSERVKCSHIQ